MTEQMPAGLEHTETAPAPIKRRRGLPGSVGMAAALILAFAWGALAYRELAPAKTVGIVAASTGTARGAAAPFAVAGTQSPPAWVNGFASAFCDGDADAIATRIGPPLDGNVAAIKNALNARQWSCAQIRYIGGGANSKGTFFVYVMSDDTRSEQWWVFTVLDEQVVAIE